MKAVFVQSRAVESAHAADALLSRFHTCGVTDIFYNVHEGGAHYESTWVPWCAAMEAGFDSLSYLCTHAHAQGLRVHVWLCPAYDLLKAGAPSCDGVTWADYGDADTQALMGAMVADLMRYDVDGVNLDYIRFPAMSNDVASPFDADDVTGIVFQAAEACDGRLLSCCVKRRSWDEWGQDLRTWADEYADLIMPMLYHPLDYPTDLPALLERVDPDFVVPILAVIDTHEDGEPLKSVDELNAELAYFADYGFIEDFAVFDERAPDALLLAFPGVEEDDDMGLSDDYAALVLQATRALAEASALLATTSAKVVEAAQALQKLADYGELLQQADATAQELSDLL